MVSPSNCQVLLVEDELEMRQLLGRTLHSRGHEVTVCADAESGWAAFQTQSYPLVLLDWILPGMQGDELCRRIRAHPAGADSVILMVTVRKAPGDLQAILEAGADDYLAKPVSISELDARLTVVEQRVARVLARRRAQEAMDEMHMALEHTMPGISKLDANGRYVSANDAYARMLSLRPADLINLSPGVIYTCKASGDFAATFISEQVEKVLGYKARAFVENPSFWLDHVHPDDREPMLAAMKVLFETGEHTHEYRFLHADGGYRWMQDKLRLVRDTQGDPMEIVGLWMDITASRIAGEELASIKRVLDSTLDMIFMFDTPTLQFNYLNHGAIVSLGYTHEELLQLHTYDIEPECSQEECRQLIAPLLSGEKQVLEFDSEHRRKDGSMFPVSVVLQLARDVQGSNRFVGVVRDITQRKLAEQRLREAKEAAEAASRAKSEFLATVSHELRTPLNAISGFTDIALYTPDLPAEVREYLDHVSNAARILGRHVSDLLDASRLKYGKLPLVAIPLDLESCIQEALEMLAPKAEAKGLELILRYARAAPRAVIGDAHRIEQIVSNLVDNAIRFTEAGYVLLEVEGRFTDQQTAELRLTVEDTGSGVPEVLREKVFEKFSQGDGSSTRAHGGLGIGLALSRDLAELMGGRLELESTSGAGSRFVFAVDLPLDSATGNDAPGVTDALRGARVLIVDEKVLTAQVLHEHVLDWRLRNGTAHSGEEALGLLRRAQDQGDPYHFAIIAIPLSDMSVEELAGKLRADPNLRKTLLLLLAPVGGERSYLPRLEAPIVGCLTRPVSPSQLMDVMVTVWTAWSEHSGHSALASALQPSADARCRVLLVEDNALARQMVTILLEMCNCRVEVAEDGARAVEMASGEDFDIVFMDLQMPLMNGYTATERIRALGGARGRVPIVALTAHASEADRDRCLQAGMDGHVAKPAGRDDLRRALGRWARKPAVPAAGGEASPAPREVRREGE